MSKISPDTLKARPWHGYESGSGGSVGSGLSAVEIGVPVVILLLLLALKAYLMAGVVATVAVTVILIRHFSAAGRRMIDRALGIFAHWVGQIVGTVLLAPVFFLGMTLVRLTHRLTGSDPLHLRSGESPTFWLPCDYESRRVRYVKRMFCSERLAQGRMSVIPLALLAVLLLVTAEIGLRIYGLREAVLYIQDYDVGYYPKPNQRVRNPGRIITINNHSMRSPDLTGKKTPGHFRILMLGDSTLAGTRVSNDELYSSLLEKKLNEAAGAPVFEVMNMGVNAWGPLHELAYVKKFGTFEADLAILCGPVTNCARPAYGLESLPLVPATHPPRLAMEYVAYQLLWQYRQGALGVPPCDVGEAQTIQMNKGVEAWGEMAEFLRKQDAEVVVELLPPSQTVLGLATYPDMEALFEKVKQRVGQAGVFANCVGPIFKGVQPVKGLYHDGVHFERLGHRLYADYLFEELKEHSVRIKKALEHP